MDGILQRHYENGPGALDSFMMAASRGIYRQVEYFVRMGFDVNIRHNNTTALAEAARFGYPKCVELLLNSGADMLPIPTGDTPLMLALINNRDECVNVLMKNKDAVQNDKNKIGCTTLMCAAIGGYPLVMQELLDTVSDIPKEIAKTDAPGDTILTFAAMSGHVDLIRDVILPKYKFQKMFLQSVADGDTQKLRRDLESEKNVKITVNSSEEIGIIPLALSVILGNLECAQLLLDFKASPDALDSNGRHALIYAAACGSSPCLELLITAKSTLCWIDKQLRTALMMACRNGHTECTSLLINAINEQQESEKRNTTFDDWTTVNNSSCIVGVSRRKGYNSIEIVSQRIYGESTVRIAGWVKEEKSDWTLPRVLANNLKMFDKLGMSALGYACHRNRKECAQLLLQAGVDPNYTVADSPFPLLLAAGEGHSGIAVELIKYGASVNAIDRNRHSALIYALSGNHPQIVKYLLSPGIATLWREDLCEAALRYAAYVGHLENLACILSYCSRIFRVYINDLLLNVAKYGHDSCMLFLLEKGATFNEKTAYKAAYLAAQRGHLPTLKFLVKQFKARVNPINGSEGSIINATCISHAPAPVLKFLISHGALVDYTDLNPNPTPLMIACWYGLDHLVKVLLEEGADIMRADGSGRRALVYAAYACSEQCIRLLLDERAKHYDHEIGYALTQATIRSSFACATALMEKTRFQWIWLNTIDNKEFLLSNLINCSIPPGFYELNHERHSPLKQALDMLDFAVVRFLLINFYLTEDDFLVLPREGRIRDKLLGKELPHLQHHDKLLVEAIFTKPWPLSTLCLLTASASITASNSTLPRRQAVDQLPIPNHFKRKLAFTEPSARICTNQWKNLYHESWYPKCLNGVLKPDSRAQVWETHLTPCKIYQCVCNGEKLMLTLEHCVKMKNLAIV